MVTAKVGTLDLSNTQYQEAKAPANTISLKADTKNMDQKSANKLYTWGWKQILVGHSLSITRT